MREKAKSLAEHRDRVVMVSLGAVSVVTVARVECVRQRVARTQLEGGAVQGRSVALASK